MNKREIFDGVAKFLGEHGQVEVVRQVRDELANGRLSERMISTVVEVAELAQAAATERAYKASSRAEFVSREEYSDADAIVLLIQATRRTTCEATAMLSEVQKMLASSGIGTVVFEPENATDERYEPPKVDDAMVAEAMNLVEEFAKLIESVEED